LRKQEARKNGIGIIVKPLTSRSLTLLLIAITVPLGFGLKYYSGPGHIWCNLYGAAVLYEVFWCLAAFLLFPSRKAIVPIAIIVFLATCGLEFLQLWRPPVLQAIRSFRPGVWLIGNGFDWWDFPHYITGCVLGWVVLNIIVPVARRSSTLIST
jgi:hypothetical protein